MATVVGCRISRPVEARCAVDAFGPRGCVVSLILVTGSDLQASRESIRVIAQVSFTAMAISQERGRPLVGTRHLSRVRTLSTGRHHQEFCVRSRNGWLLHYFEAEVHGRLQVRINRFRHTVPNVLARRPIMERIRTGSVQRRLGFIEPL